MTITAAALKREFEFNGVKLNDPGPEFSVEDVRDGMAAMYPDLATATLEEPVVNGDVVLYKFVRNVGTKG